MDIQVFSRPSSEVRCGERPIHRENPTRSLREIPRGFFHLPLKPLRKPLLQMRPPLLRASRFRLHGATQRLLLQRHRQSLR